MIEVRCYDSFAAAAGLRAPADALNCASTRPDPFSTFEFFETFHRHDEAHPAGRGLGLWLLAAFRGGRLVGYAALRRVMRHHWGLPYAMVGFLVTHDTDRPHVVAREADLVAVTAAFYRYLLSRREEWSLLEFQQQDAASPLLLPPPGVDLGACRVSSWPSLENGTVHLRWPSLAGYLEALPKKFRANLGRQVSALLAAGRVELLASGDPRTTPLLFELYLGIEAHSWKSRAGATIARHPCRIAYFRSLLEANQPMQVTIQLLLLDGVPVAGLINGAFGDGLYALQIAYDEQLARLAPGSAMLLLGVREAIAGGRSFFNLLSGFGYYKTRWLAEITETRVAQIYRRGSLPWWHRLAGDLKRRLMPAAAPRAPARFNPTRRALAARGLPPAPAWPADARARIDTLVAQARYDGAEFLGADQLAAALPLRPAH